MLKHVKSKISRLRLSAKNYKNRDTAWITCTGKKDGIGAQVAANLSTIVFAESHFLKFVYTPFASVAHNPTRNVEWEDKWDSFFNLQSLFPLSCEIKPISERQLALPNLSRFLSEPGCLYSVGHCHPFTDYYTSRYDRIMPALRNAYMSVPKENAFGTFDLKNILAVHIRRGDVSKTENSDRFEPISLIGRKIATILNQHPNLKVHIFSEGEEASFVGLSQFDPVMHLNICPFTTFHSMTCAGHLLTGKSSFSYVAGLYSQNVVYYTNCGLNPATSWITIKVIR